MESVRLAAEQTTFFWKSCAYIKINVSGGFCLAKPQIYEFQLR